MDKKLPFLNYKGHVLLFVLLSLNSILCAQDTTFQAPGTFSLSTVWSIGVVTKETEFSGHKGKDNSAIYTYNEYGNLIAVNMDYGDFGNVAVARLEYDSLQRLIKISELTPLSNGPPTSLRCVYDSFGNRVASLYHYAMDSTVRTDTIGLSAYDSLGRNIWNKQFEPFIKKIDYFEEIEYLKNGTKHTASHYSLGKLERKTVTIRDSLGRLIMKEDGGSSKRSQYRYHHQGPILIISDSKGKQEKYYKGNLIYQDSYEYWDSVPDPKPKVHMHLEGITRIDEEQLSIPEDPDRYEHYDCFFYSNGQKQKEIFERREYHGDSLELTQVIYDYSLNNSGLLASRKTSYVLQGNYSSWLNYHSFKPGPIGTIDMFLETYRYDDHGKRIEYLKFNTEHGKDTVSRHTFSYSKHGKLLEEKRFEDFEGRLGLMQFWKYSYDELGREESVRLLASPTYYPEDNDIVVPAYSEHITYHDNGQVAQRIDSTELTGNTRTIKQVFDVNGNPIKYSTRLWTLYSDSMQWVDYGENHEREYINTRRERSVGQGLAHVVQLSIPQAGIWKFDFSESQVPIQIGLQAGEIQKDSVLPVQHLNKPLNPQLYILPLAKKNKEYSFALNQGFYTLVIAGIKEEDKGLYTLRIGSASKD